PEAVSGPRWFTIASAADLTREPPLLSPDQMSILHSDHSYERQRGEGAEWKQGIASLQYVKLSKPTGDTLIGSGVGLVHQEGLIMQIHASSSIAGVNA
ncbi:hypothetical protein KUCAC02_006332, partial [Chaenocephalus aceratus]